MLNIYRAHLFSDLRPYTCFYASCDWISTPFSTREQWCDHLETEHNLGPAWESRQYPLCLDMTGSGKRVILSHFGRHMEDISLVALQTAIDSDDDSEANPTSRPDLLEHNDPENAETQETPDSPSDFEFSKLAQTIAPNSGHVVEEAAEQEKGSNLAKPNIPRNFSAPEHEPLEELDAVMEQEKDAKSPPENRLQSTVEREFSQASVRDQSPSFRSPGPSIGPRSVDSVSKNEAESEVLQSVRDLNLGDPDGVQ